MNTSLNKLWLQAKVRLVASIMLPATLLFSIVSNSIAQSDPELTEVWTPVPEIVTAGDDNNAPSDATVLFNGSDLIQWTNGKGDPAGWVVEDGVLTVKPGTGVIKTKLKFADCQLHIEWRSPAVVKGDGQGRGNSGVFLQERYEVQVLDSYENTTYANGQAGSIYKQHIPLVNVTGKPDTWQIYDIIFTAPRFTDNGTLKSPAYVTVLHNGVIIQNHVEIRGSTAYIGEPEYKKHALKESLVLQDHGNPVSFRNIWIRDITVPNL